MNLNIYFKDNLTKRISYSYQADNSVTTGVVVQMESEDSPAAAPKGAVVGGWLEVLG